MDLCSWPIIGGILGSIKRWELKEQTREAVLESRKEQWRKAANELLNSHGSNLAEAIKNYQVFAERLREAYTSNRMRR